MKNYTSYKMAEEIKGLDSIGSEQSTSLEAVFVINVNVQPPKESFMLPQTFRIPGRRHNYVDLNDVFEMYELSGRFRDWVRLVVS